jgi:superfamily I DNA/RNA helicase
LEGEGVFCGTMHRSKGLEFRAVFLVHVNEDVVPPKNAIESVLDDEEIEEIIKQERSLLYVASTRVRERLYILSYGTPSRLLQ